MWTTTSPKQILVCFPPSLLPTRTCTTRSPSPSPLSVGVSHIKPWKQCGRKTRCVRAGGEAFALSFVSAARAASGVITVRVKLPHTHRTKSSDPQAEKHSKQTRARESASKHTVRPKARQAVERTICVAHATQATRARVEDTHLLFFLGQAI